jgi:dipeptidyl aminopeptidase/acylaminoacyl peptidase
MRQPGTGQISDASELHVAPDGSRAVFTGHIVNALEGVPVTRICLVHLQTGDLRVLTFGPNQDRTARFSPDGRRIAFLSDRHEKGNFQLYVHDLASGAARATPLVDGWVEYFRWSPDGKRLLLGVAGHGADIAGGQGAVSSKPREQDAASWMPDVDEGNDSHQWRSAWIYEPSTQRTRCATPAGLNIWEAAWCGNDTFVAVVSSGPGEGSWYGAHLERVHVETLEHRKMLSPHDQLGMPEAAPSGRHVAVISAVCSDRGIVAGEVMLIDANSGVSARIDTRRVDVSYVEWRSDRLLLLAGHRAFEMIVGLYDVVCGDFREIWTSTEICSGGRYLGVSGCGASGDFALQAEGFLRAPEIAVVTGGRYRTVRSLDVGYGRQSAAIAGVEQVAWRAPDGLGIQGWLLRPQGEGPHPLVMNVHGGPVWRWSPMWLGRSRSAPMLMLARRGCAIFLPNPRGSTGLGTEFVRHVVGDMGGADTYDYLSGLDHLVARGVADPKRLGVFGISYGGFIASWIVTRDARFAGAVSVSPVNNYVTQHLLSNIPQFVSLFLADDYTNCKGRYYERSPVLFANRVKTPVLHVCGALDRCTPAVEAMQFHNAIRENGGTSSLVVYPEEGHGVSGFPAAIDYAARLIGWFDAHGITTRTSRA